MQLAAIPFDTASLMPVQDWRETKVWAPASPWWVMQGYFDVDATISEERVKRDAHKFRNRYGDILEGQGLTVLAMTEVERDDTFVTRGVLDQDLHRYRVFAKVTRRPKTVRLEVPDEDVPIYQRAGYRLLGY